MSVDLSDSDESDEFATGNEKAQQNADNQETVQIKMMASGSKKPVDQSWNNVQPKGMDKIRSEYQEVDLLGFNN